MKEEQQIQDIKLAIKKIIVLASTRLRHLPNEPKLRSGEEENILNEAVEDILKALIRGSK